jgi:hypothetical protein
LAPSNPPDFARKIPGEIPTNGFSPKKHGPGYHEFMMTFKVFYFTMGKANTAWWLSHPSEKSWSESQLG